MCALFYFTGARLLAVKGFEKCDFELFHVRSQFDQCLQQRLLALGQSEPLIDESFMRVYGLLCRCTLRKSRTKANQSLKKCVSENVHTAQDLHTVPFKH